MSQTSKHKQPFTFQPVFQGGEGGPCRGLVKIGVAGGVVANWAHIWQGVGIGWACGVKKKFGPLAAVRAAGVCTFLSPNNCELPTAPATGVANLVSSKRQHHAVSFDGDLIGSTTGGGRVVS